MAKKKGSPELVTNAVKELLTFPANMCRGKLVIHNNYSSGLLYGISGADADEKENLALEGGVPVNYEFIIEPGEKYVDDFPFPGKVFLVMDTAQTTKGVVYQAQWRTA